MGTNVQSLELREWDGHQLVREAVAWYVTRFCPRPFRLPDWRPPSQVTIDYKPGREVRATLDLAPERLR